MKRMRAPAFLVLVLFGALGVSALAGCPNESGPPPGSASSSSPSASAHPEEPPPAPPSGGGW